VWRGKFEEEYDKWLRWCDEHGNIIPTGRECAEQESRRAEQESRRAEQESRRAEQESRRAEQERLEKERILKHADADRQYFERVLAQMKALGIEPIKK